MASYQQADEPDPDALVKCAITNESIEELDEYMLYGHFRGGQMVRARRQRYRVCLAPIILDSERPTPVPR